MLFAASSAKRSVVKDFEAVTKLALLHKIKKAELPPDVSNPFEEDVSAPENENSTPENDISADNSEQATVDESNETDIEIFEDNGIGFGDILIYIFVGATLIGATVAVCVGIGRKSARPKNAHMPKRYNGNNKE
jgi:hypothetical protein